MSFKKTKSDNVKLCLGLAVLVAVLFISGCAQQIPQNQTKTVSVPTEIKSQSEASTLENDTSSILKEVGDSLNNIDSSLPDV